jgi:hypothetical protein
LFQAIFTLLFAGGGFNAVK